MQSLPKIALHQPCAGGIQDKSFPRRIVGTTQRAAMSAQSAAAAQEEYQFKSSTAPGDRGNRRAERSRRVPWGVRGREHHGGRGASRQVRLCSPPDDSLVSFCSHRKKLARTGETISITLYLKNHPAEGLTMEVFCQAFFQKSGGRNRFKSSLYHNAGMEPGGGAYP